MTKRTTSKDMFSSHMSPWVKMDDKDWASIISDATLETFKKGDTIYHQGDMTTCLYLVKKGRVVLDVYAKNGKKRSIYIADQGTCFGELSCLDQYPCYCTTTACTKTELYLIPRERFLKELDVNPNFSLALLRSLALKTRLITGLLEQLSFDDSYTRFYHSLMGLIERYGVQTKEGHYRLSIKFTHQEMAYQTGLSRVSISNIFLTLTNKGYLTKDQGYLVVQDLDGLQEYLLSEDL